ncbi:ATP-binding protein [Brachybacterium sp. MASK1Z-5]|uniref:ATP-binding protein n=1 Tax=Brachybacterium halotolerans TaxID=2795215 RepID=A0ABS1B6I4_9MICO|nr:histidine kinase [Brachybacterium halotolerans]MBK0330224.1 ATP-binding protein [Brachybacterium halotolerans]
MTSRTPTSPRPAEASLHELAAAVGAGGDVEDLLDLLVRAVPPRTGAAGAALVLPQRRGEWSVEVAEGREAPLLLGAAPTAGSALHTALVSGDPEAVGAVAELVLEGRTWSASAEIVEAGDQGPGALLALGGETSRQAAQRALEPLALLVSLALDDRRGTAEQDLDDERRRIARDLHDLAIQELFAVGMELEGLTSALDEAAGAVSNATIRRSVETSLLGVENAVAQIRQIVQSLRRERSEATLSERLRHETGLATAGLGFAPALRLPRNAAAMDAEVPEEIAEDVVAVVREALANAARHAHASAVAVSVTLFSEGVDRVVQVAVSDNGRGIDPTVSRRSGLANMSSRARRHQGWVDAISLEPGTMINWRVTLPPA